MDYEWNYYLKEEKERLWKINVSALHKTIAMFQARKSIFTEQEIKNIRNIVAYQYRKYRELDDSRKKMIERLLKCHTAVCKARPEDVRMKRRHNVLVYKYMIDTIAGNKVIANKMGMDKDSIYTDLEIIYQEMILMCVGSDPLLHRNYKKGNILIELLKGYQILSKVKELEEIVQIFPVKMRGKVIESRNNTIMVMEQLTNVLNEYESYSQRRAQGEDKRKRRLDSLWLIWKSNGSSIEEIATVFPTVVTQSIVISS